MFHSGNMSMAQPTYLDKDHSLLALRSSRHKRFLHGEFTRLAGNSLKRS